MKRIYFLIAIAAVECLVGSVMMLGAAAPLRTSLIVPIGSGGDYHQEFDIVWTGRLTGNLSELQDRPFDVFVFDAPGYASFRDGPAVVPPLLTQNGTSIVFGVDLTGSGPFHLVVGDFPARGELQVQLDIVVLGLKTGGTILATVVLVGGLTLIGASLMMSVWAWRHKLPSADPPSSTPDSDPFSNPPDPAAQPPRDDTKIY